MRVVVSGQVQGVFFTGPRGAQVDDVAVVEEEPKGETQFRVTR